MLRILGSPKRFCDGLTRRDMLLAGGLGLAALPGWITPKALSTGLIFLGCLPSTIQSSIGFTVIARGDIPAAVASASAALGGTTPSSWP